MALAQSQTLLWSRDQARKLPCLNSHAHWNEIFTLQTPTNVRNTVECKVIWKTRDGKCSLCRTKLVQEGKSWKAQNLQSLPPSNISRSRSKLSNLCSNNWAKLHSYPHFQYFMHTKPRSGCHHLSSNLDWSWNWLAVGSGLPRNDFVWPIVLNLCSLLSLFQC